MPNTTTNILESFEKGLFIAHSNATCNPGTIAYSASNNLDSTLNVNNIISPYIDEMARFDVWHYDEETDEYYIDIYLNFDQIQRISFVGLCGIETNYPTNKLEDLRVQIFYSKTDLIKKETIQPVKQVKINTDEYLILRNNNLDFFHPDFWFGYPKDLFTRPDKKLITTPIIFESAVNCKALRIRISISNPFDSHQRIFWQDYYIDVSHIFAGKYDTYDINYEQIANFGVIGGESTPTVANSWRGQYRGEYRYCTVSIDNLDTESEAYLKKTVLGRRPTYERYFIILYPWQLQYIYDHSMLCIASSTSNSSNLSFDNYMAEITFTETN